MGKSWNKLGGLLLTQNAICIPHRTRHRTNGKDMGASLQVYSVWFEFVHHYSSEVIGIGNRYYMFSFDTRWKNMVVIERIPWEASLQQWNIIYYPWFSSASSIFPSLLKIIIVPWTLCSAMVHSTKKIDR